MWLPLILLSVFTTSSTVAAPEFPISMDLVYCYEDSPCGEAEWTFYEDGRLEDNLGGEGDWTWSRGTMELIYDHGSMYRGSMNPETGCMDGRNLHADGRRGEWEACRG